MSDVLLTFTLAGLVCFSAPRMGCFTMAYVLEYHCTNDNRFKGQKEDTKSDVPVLPPMDHAAFVRLLSEHLAASWTKQAGASAKERMQYSHHRQVNW